MVEQKDIEFKESLSLVDYIIILLKWKRLLIVSTLLITAISIILFFFVFDLIYFSTATIKSSSKATFGLSGIEGLPDISGLEDLTGGGKSTKELALYEQILVSRRCLEPLIIKFNLMNRDEYEFIEDAIKVFKSDKMLIERDRLSGVLNIGVYDKDKLMAKEMVEFLLEELNKINIELNVTNAKNNREFIEKRYIQSKEDLSKAEDSLKAFQQIYGVAPDLQIKATAQSIFSLEAELKAEEIKLDVLKKILSAEQPEVKVQEAKISALETKITEIQNSTDLTDLLRLGNSPQITLAFIRLQREVEIQSKIMSFLIPIYEQAKIEEKRETPTVIVLEKPFVAEKKSKPKRLTMVFVSTVLAFIFFSISIVVFELYVKKLILKVKSLK